MSVPTFFPEDCLSCGRATLAPIESFGEQVICSRCREPAMNGGAAAKRRPHEEPWREWTCSSAESVAQREGASR